ncbi:hypothetical protein [Frankia sp. BMG5.23]|uniref:hypothetical protein n=1 Tax=Frankia sp. BMG5.23 TaxID=683305 RepID=UPI000460B454|nr:hypothetical protein [Frankia sp. BMG5.23]KDA44520.1 hypothetical protein BMG523Draft_00697 [Frankia sp. BMG5.23]
MTALIVVLMAVAVVGACFGIAYAWKTAREAGMPWLRARHIQNTAQSAMNDIREETRRAEERMLRAAFFPGRGQGGRWGQ